MCFLQQERRHRFPSLKLQTVTQSSTLYRKPNPLPPPTDLPTEILPRLYISNIYAVENSHIMSSLGITHVLSAMTGTVVIPNNLSVKHCQIPLVDSPFSELVGFLPLTTSFLREALEDERARVLVHCHQGISRSVSVIAAFLISEYGWSLHRAVTFIKSKRACAEPNAGFLIQLNEYSQTLELLT